MFFLSVTVSAKISRQLREKLRKKHVDINSVVRRALQEELDRREDEELRAKLDCLSFSHLGKKISRKDVVEAVRSSRDMR